MYIGAKIKSENGHYKIDFVKSYKGKRLRIYKNYIESYEEAVELIPKLVDEKIKHREKNVDKTSFGIFYQKYLDFRSMRVCPSSLANLKALKQRYYSDFRDLPAREIFEYKNIHNWYDKIMKFKVCRKTLNRVIGEMKNMAQFAFREHIINDKTLQDVLKICLFVRIENKPKEKSYFSEQQLCRFFAVIKSKEDLEMFKVLSYAGLRISEFCGLMRDVYDEKKKTLEIKRQSQTIDRELVLSDRLKRSESYRIIPLNNEINEILKNRKLKSLTKEGFIFPRCKRKPNEPLSKTTITGKIRNYCKKAKLPRISPHGFRHSRATILAALCKDAADIKAASKFMGHSVGMFMDTYVHASEKNINSIISRIKI